MFSDIDIMYYINAFYKYLISAYDYTIYNTWLYIVYSIIY